jgi:hypothetical protein
MFHTERLSKVASKGQRRSLYGPAFAPRFSVLFFFALSLSNLSDFYTKAHHHIQTSRRSRDELWASR